MKYLTIFTLASAILTSCHKTQTIKSGFAEVNGTKLYYEVAGQGAPIVFSHGNFRDRNHRDYQFMSLSEKFKVIRYDLRGFGESDLPKSDEPYSHWDDLKGLLEFLKIDKAHIWDLSGGSSAAVGIALTYPQMCSSLIPIGP